MEQQEKSIYDFNKGDIITRIKPVIRSEIDKDYSLVGEKLEFLGIANACIYLSKNLKDSIFFAAFLGEHRYTIKLPLDLAENGWAEYIEIKTNPDKSIEDLSKEDTSLNSKEFKSKKENLIKKKIDTAIKKENYEEAEKLKQILKDLKDEK